MTPKEKAIELCLKFSTDGLIMDDEIRYGLIAAEEIKNHLLEVLDNEVSGIHAIYWNKVKEEIEKL